MNTKPLVAGFILGLSLALAPSCGGTKACGPSSCTGCCDTKGECQQGASNNACGQLGGVCNVCQLGQSCNFGTCSGGIGQGGGTGTGGGGTTGGGGGTTGGGGGTTGGGGGTTGGGGGTNLQPIGGPCTSAANCEGGLVCKQTTARGDATLPGGYCTKACSASTDCGGASVCAGGPSSALQFYGETAGFCAGPCASAGTQSTCRTGYGCYGTTGSPGFCYLETLPAFNGGGTPQTGKACTGDTECQNPPSPLLGFCFTPTTSTGAPSVWTQGYCSADCGYDVSNTFCGTNGACVTLGTAPDTFNACLLRCSGPGTRSTCRAGYTCSAFDATGGLCFPDCVAIPCTSGTCNTATGQCS